MDIVNSCEYHIKQNVSKIMGKKQASKTSKYMLLSINIKILLVKKKVVLKTKNFP